MRSQIYVAGFLVAGLFAFGSSSFAGGRGRGHSEHEHQDHREHHWHGRYYWYEWGPWYPGYPGYASNYPFAYVATDEQKTESLSLSQGLRLPTQGTK